ncbi:hypothetical protein D1007_49563 [Hordeum vulgare]|nr:hypothetical protein D1007_49563 [Hordeum vulgare]
MKTGEGRKTMTEEDIAAAALYRAKGEQGPKGEAGRLSAMNEWIATGDPEAIRISHQLLPENVEDMKLEPKDPTDWPAVQAKDYRRGNLFGPAPLFPFPEIVMGSIIY